MAATKKTATKNRASAAKKSSKKALELPDLSHALPEPLSTTQMRPLLKIGDNDRAIAARAGKLLAKHEKALSIPGVTSNGVLDGVRAADAIVQAEAQLTDISARLMGARLLADDSVWKSITTLHRRLQSEGSRSPKVLADFEFLMDYFKRRSPGSKKANGSATKPPAAKA
jgi:hypothetical protein